LYCHTDASTGRIVALLVLAAVVVGWRPRWTAIPHAWVAVSLVTSTTVIDSGDVLACNLVLLTLPLVLTDRRRWVWQSPVAGRPVTTLIAWSSLLAARVQVAFLYFHAMVGKFGVREWADGTAMYYILRQPGFVAPEWVQTIIEVSMRYAIPTALATWLPLAIEGVLATALLLPRALRVRLLLPLGIGFHLAIWIVIGIASFSMTVIGALILYLVPIDARDRRDTLPHEEHSTGGGLRLQPGGEAVRGHAAPQRPERASAGSKASDE
jgi:antimicrobial peptide system SdpB family protein